VSQADIIQIEGQAGIIDVLIEGQGTPSSPHRGIAWIGHPHPLYGGTRDNKVVQTLAKAFQTLGYCTLRPNFRGVGNSQGSFDNALGETDDALQTIRWAQHNLHASTAEPTEWVLAGFSFGSVVAARVHARHFLDATIKQQMVLIGTATSRWEVPPVPPDSLIVHCDDDDVIPLSSIMPWATQNELAVQVLSGGGHFFHGKLNHLKNLVYTHWHRPDLLVEVKQ
jgi:uncharacterized protein